MMTSAQRRQWWARRQPSTAPLLLPHLAEPIDAYALAGLAGTTYTGAVVTLKAMQRRGMVRKIVRRKAGRFLSHLWVAV